MQPLQSLLLAGLLLSMLASCARLPDYARPSAIVGDPGTAGAADAIPYRKISEADFRATSPPPQIADHASEFGAYTCAVILPTSAEQRVDIAPDSSSSGHIAQAPDAMFQARMDRGCSWWNPAGSVYPREYVLQHEQIHFALAEIAARRLTEKIRGLQERGTSPELAAVALQRSVEAATERAVDQLVEVNTDFDEDTSARYAPEVQARWFARANAELRQGE